MKFKQRRIKVLGLLLMLAGFCAPRAHADDTSANISIAKFLSNAKWGGDLRIRQENFWKSTAGNVDRSRQRFRLRYGLEATMQDITVFFKMASGTGEQVSTNQSFDNLSSQKPLWIDLAFIQWKTYEWMKLSAGRMNNPLWRNYASDLVWDGDFNPEGFAQQFEYKFGERFTPFANFMQIVLDEDSTDNRDQWMYSFQLGSKIKILDELSLDLAGTYNRPTFETVNFLAGGVNNEGNTRAGTSDVLTATFSVVHLTSQINARFFRWPWKIQADYIKNVSDNGHLHGDIANDQAGYQAGTIIGKASAAKTWEVAYFYKYVETNATIADISDSDFGDGGTNRKGHILWFSFAPRDYLTLTAKFFNTEVLHPRYQATATGGITTIAPGADNINRFQLDLVCKF